MAGRIIFSKTLKAIHLYLSLVIFIMTFLYISTGYIMSKHNWFKGGDEQVIKSVMPLNYIPDTTNLDLLGKAVAEQFEISGRATGFRNGMNQIQFVFVKPGERNRVVIHHALDSVSITQTSKKSLQEISTRIHRLHGFEGGALYKAWAILLDITAIAMLLFVVTGILIWIRFRNMYFWGSVILISTVVIGIGMFWYLK